MAQPKPTYMYRATLDRLIDADTVALVLDLGFRLTAKLPIRLLGLNAPEKATPAGKASAAWVAVWFQNHTDLMVVTEKSPEKYGRWLGTIYGSGPELDLVSLNSALIAANMALPWDGQGPRPI